MKIRLKKYITNFILTILAMQILNMSITCRITDESFFSQIDNSINIADHAVEFIAEDILGFSNAFPEVKENKQQHHVSYSQKVQEFELFTFQLKSTTFYHSIQTAGNYSPCVVYPYSQYLWEINTPPPRIGKPSKVFELFDVA